MNPNVAADEQSPQPPANPWPGLTSYTEEDRERFFGRADEIAQLIRHIERDTLTVLFGRSGLGKTSLIRAGVFPKLRELGYLPILIRIDHSVEAPHPVEQVKAYSREAAVVSGIDWAWVPEAPREDGDDRVKPRVYDRPKRGYV